jgi:hypothetical protein
LALLYYFQYINFERRAYKDPIFFSEMEIPLPKFSLGRDSPGVELFDEKDSAKEEAQGFLEGSRWTSQLSLFPA